MAMFEDGPRYVMGCDPKPQIDAAIAIPTRLVCEDGRVIGICRWHPDVCVDGVVRVHIEGIIELKEIS